MAWAGEKPGVLKPGDLDFCAETARDQSNDLVVAELAREAAYLIWCLTANHVFVEGNKRTAYQVACVFLLSNGHMLSGARPSEVIRLLVGVDRGDLTRSQLAAWLEQHLIPIPQKRV